ncbi:hypothetical protein CHS0354_005955 [Potamilus streckersoni]|uniref:Uncharacterized protein n=1 Tax=Potamilus streckersoni TaxID=2493646 RepID=A0AAE0SNV5_9BIVA|nr:hypothetical protein CHS0354_005955 [Potamilus streckersoni]
MHALYDPTIHITDVIIPHPQEEQALCEAPSSNDGTPSASCHHHGVTTSQRSNEISPIRGMKNATRPDWDICTDQHPRR